MPVPLPYPVPSAVPSPAPSPAPSPVPSPARRRASWTTLSLTLLAAACGGAPGSEAADSPESPDTVAGTGAAVPVGVWFSRDEAPVRVERRVEPSAAGAAPEAALRALVAGPTAAERAEGLSSWFSDATAGSLSAVERRDGFLIVDFRGLDRAIPGAGSSAGSAQLLAALDSTVFQFPSVDSVEYRLEGSCEAFWAWLQRACQVVRRP